MTHKSVLALCDCITARHSQRAPSSPNIEASNKTIICFAQKSAMWARFGQKLVSPSPGIGWVASLRAQRSTFKMIIQDRRLGAGFTWELSFPEHDISWLLGLPPKMVTGFQKQSSQESLLEVTLPWKSWGITSAAIVLSLPTFKEDPDPTSQWKECQSHIARRMCRMGVNAVTVSGKLSLSHHTFTLWCALSKRVDTDLVRSGKWPWIIAFVTCVLYESTFCTQCHLFYVMSISVE